MIELSLQSPLKTFVLKSLAYLYSECYLTPHSLDHVIVPYGVHLVVDFSLSILYDSVCVLNHRQQSLLKRLRPCRQGIEYADCILCIVARPPPPQKKRTPDFLVSDMKA